MNVAEIAAAVGGRVEGDGSIVIGGLSSLQEAGPGDLSFLGNVRFAAQAEKSLAAAIMVTNEWAGTSPATLIRVANPDRAFIQAAILLTPVPPPPAAGVHPTAVVAPGVELGEGVRIGPHAVIEAGVRLGARTVIGASCYIGHDTTLGEDCRLHPLVSIRERTRIGKRVIVHNGTVIGSDGFGYTPEHGAWTKIPQLGTVEIGDDVELGANVTIDRARFGKTIIGNGVKIDNLVQIAHNVHVGDHTVMAAQAGIAGSAIIGRHVQVGGQVGMAGHLTIGDRALLAAQSGISKSIPEGSVVFGTPAMPFDKFKRIHAYLSRLPELKKRVDELEERLEKLAPRAAVAEQGKP